MKERNQIDNKYKWDLTKFCKNDDDFYAKLKKLEVFINKIKKFEGKLNSENELYACWEMNDEFCQKVTLLLCYANYRCDENQGDSKASEMQQKINKVCAKYSEASSFIEPEIANFPMAKLVALKSNPKFKKFIPYIKESIKKKKHILSKAEENLLSGMSEFLGATTNIFQKYDYADAKFEDVENSKGEKLPLDFSKFSEYFESEDRKVRENTFKNLNKEYAEHINFITENYVTSVKEDCFFAKKRKYKSALQSSIERENASEKVYYKLIEKVRQNVDIVSEYFKIKAKKLKLKDFKYYDKYAPIGEIDNEKISFETAIDMVCEAVSPLGEDYVGLVRRAVKENWMDVYPNKGKHSGAYCSGPYGTTPVVLLNFDEKKSYVSTIAHELGHAMHSYFSNSNQPYQTADYVIFVAEVASTVNEMLLWRNNIVKCKNKNQKIKLFDDLFSLVNSTIFRQTMFAEFEAKCHEMEEQGLPLTKDNLCDMYLELNKFYHGKSVDVLDEIKYEWARIPHFYTPFYVYKYATGLISALSLSKKIYERDEDAIKKYIKFLSAGCSKDPIQLLKDAGVDLKTDEAFDDVFAWLKEMLEEFKKL